MNKIDLCDHLISEKFGMNEKGYVASSALRFPFIILPPKITNYECQYPVKPRETRPGMKPGHPIFQFGPQFCLTLKKEGASEAPPKCLLRNYDFDYICEFINRIIPLFSPTRGTAERMKIHKY
jgi:hypothetical protein